MLGPSAPAGGSRAGGWWARLSSPDARAAAVLVVLPVLFFALPAAAGHPAITGDNLIQNFPLRVLSGNQMRQGHLPLWNPYIWSGSPLLGGLNAGSFYPLSFFFVVLPPVGAWVVNLLGVYWAAGLGMYALVRQYRLRPLASLLGAVTYAFSGTMSGQIVHLGVVQGMGWMPLLVLAELRLSWAVLGTGPSPSPSSERSPSSPWKWIALLALVVGLEALTGEPRAMAETEIVGPAVALWLLLRPYAGRVPVVLRLRYLGAAVLAGVWGAALAAAELAPGWSFIRASQRATESFGFFGSGSLPVHWSAILLVPELFGGVGVWGQPRWFLNYNLPEVTGYVGLLPVAAALVLLTRSFGRRRDPSAGDWGMWLALAGLGLLLAWGSFTPFGHLWAQIPLFGKTRLQSRNLEIVDLALAVLLAFWLDRLLSTEGAAGVTGWRRFVAVAPAVAAAALCAAALIGPAGFTEAFGATARGAKAVRDLWPWYLGSFVVAGGVAALVFGWRRLGRQARGRWLASLVVADLGLFVLATSTVTAPPTVVVEPGHAQTAAVLGSHGRFAIYDTTASNISAATAIGQPDLNSFTRLPSVQGYGSIVSGTYGTATGTHKLDTLDPCALARGVFRPLRLSSLAVLPRFVAPAARSDGRAPPAPRPCPGAPLPGTAHRRVLYLGWSTELTSATLAIGGPPDRRRPRVGVLTADGGARWPTESVRPTTSGGWHVRFRRPQRAAGLVVEGPARSVLDTSTVTGPGGRWTFNGRLQDALGTPGWRFAGSWQMYGLFERASVPPPVWLAEDAPGSSARQVSATDWGTAVVRVVASRPVTVVRSESYQRGWRAELVPASGRGARAEVVRRHGLLQSVRVPAGAWTVRFVYRAPRLTAGVAGSVVAVAGFVALAATGVLGRRRARRRTVASGG